MTNKNFKKQEAAKLARLFDKGYLKGTETGYKILERWGKKFTRVEMTFVADIRGIDLSDRYITNKLLSYGRQSKDNG